MHIGLLTRLIVDIQAVYAPRQLRPIAFGRPGYYGLISLAINLTVVLNMVNHLVGPVKIQTCNHIFMQS